MMRAMIMTNRPADSVDWQQGRVKTLTFPIIYASTGNRVKLKQVHELPLKSMGNTVELKNGLAQGSFGRRETG